jgi:hypothetical protein
MDVAAANPLITPAGIPSTILPGTLAEQLQDALQDSEVELSYCSAESSFGILLNQSRHITVTFQTRTDK